MSAIEFRLSLLAVVRSCGGTGEEADAVLSRLSSEVVAGSCAGMEAQVLAALEAVRSAS